MSAISEKSFKQIKVFQAALHDAIKHNFADSTAIDVTNDFINGHSHSQNGVCDLLDTNDDLMIALNLDVKVGYFGVHIKNTGDEPDDPNFSVQDLADEVDELVKHGREGIEKIVDTNNQRFRQIRKITDKMDNAYEN